MGDKAKPLACVADGFAVWTAIIVLAEMRALSQIELTSC
jgi:hypothetical protein